MQSNYSQALVEVNEVLKFTDPELTKKIPESFRAYILANMSHNYTFSISEEDLSENIVLKEETKNILALIYRNFFCSPKEKAHLLEVEKENRKSNPKVNNIHSKQSTIVINELFPNSYQNSSMNNTKIITSEVSDTIEPSSALPIIKSKEKWYIVLLEKLLNKLKNLN